MKIFATAILSVVLLKRQLALKKWVSLCLLFFGVVLVNLDMEKDKKSPNSDALSVDSLLGLLAVFTCAWTSGFAGVWYEKLLKNDKMDIFVTNIQLSFISILICLGVGLTSKYQIITENGPLSGFSVYAWVFVFICAFNGITVAFVIKYADNILKSFATSFSIVLSSILSIYLFNFKFTSLFVVGTTIVIGSLGLYNLPQH